MWCCANNSISIRENLLDIGIKIDSLPTNKPIKYKHLGYVKKELASIFKNSIGLINDGIEVYHSESHKNIPYKDKGLLMCTLKKLLRHGTLCPGTALNKQYLEKSLTKRIETLESLK